MATNDPTNAEDILADAADAAAAVGSDPAKPDPVPAPAASKGEGDGGDKLKVTVLISTAVVAVLGAIFAIAKKIRVKEEA